MVKRCQASDISVISIHALLAESDQASFGVVLGQQIFLSTLSLRRATAFFQQAADITQISIHALLAESDCITAQPQHRTHQISIHALLAESDDILLQPALAF